VHLLGVVNEITKLLYNRENKIKIACRPRKPERQCFISYLTACSVYGYIELFKEALQINVNRIRDNIVIYAATIGGSKEIMEHIHPLLNSYNKDLAVYFSIKYNHPAIYNILSEGRITKGTYLKNICIIPDREWLPNYYKSPSHIKGVDISLAIKEKNYMVCEKLQNKINNTHLPLIKYMQYENLPLYRKLIANAVKYPISIYSTLMLDDIELVSQIFYDNYLVQKCIIFGADNIASYYLGIDVRPLSLIKKVKILVLHNKNIKFKDFALFVLNSRNTKLIKYYETLHSGMYSVIFEKHIDDLTKLSTDVFNFLFNNGNYNFSKYPIELLFKTGISGLRWCIDNNKYVELSMIETYTIENDDVEFLSYVKINDRFLERVCKQSCIDIIRVLREMGVKYPYNLSDQPRINENNV
jgi:hypothetical protein